MTDFDYLRIAKWVLIVLLAGFIGQFGKTLAKHLMEKARLKEKGFAPETPFITGRAGIEDTPGVQKPSPTAISQGEQAKRDKKLAKTLAKQKKKEAKAFKQ